MFNLAMEWKTIGSNPIQEMKLLKVPRYLPRVLKEEEFEKLYNAASFHFKPILFCAYLTGMRKGEIITLKWKDLDLKESYIYLKEKK